MAGIKLNIVRSKSKQIAPSNDCTKSESLKPSESKKKLLKSMFKSSREGQDKLLKSKQPECNVSDKDRTEFSEFTIEHGLLADCDARRTCTAPLAEISEKPRHQPVQHPRNSWVCSSWDPSESFCDNSEEEEDLDDSLYQLLDAESSEHSPKAKKLSLHNILVEEELSFQKSLVWNED
jgi:hypothetical protein